MSEQALFPAGLTSSAVSTDMRRAALLTRRLDLADRAWLLGSLSVPQRIQLEALLVELAELGIPDDAAVLQQVLDESQETQPMPGDDRHYLRHLSDAKIRVLSLCLRAEPPALTRQLLQIEAWPWQDQLMAAWDAGWRRQVELPLQQTAPPGAASDVKPHAVAPKLQQVLLQGIAHRVRILSDEVTPPTAGVPLASTTPPSSLLGRVLRPIVMRFTGA